MKRILTLLTLLVVSVGSYAQSWTLLTPDTVSASGVNADFEIITKATLKNNTNAPLTLKWIRITNNLPQMWQSAICDENGSCYAPTVDSMTLTIPASGTTRIDLHFFINNTPGAGTARLRVSPLSGTGTSRILTFQGTAFVTSSADHSKPTINFYPNPTRNVLNVKVSDQIRSGSIEVYSVIGTKVLSEPVNPMDEIIPLQVSHLPRGTYIIRLNAPQQGILISRTFQKF
jgi:hypothetical protein